MGVVEPTLCSKIPPWPFYRYGIFTILLYPSFFCNLFISRKPINGIDWPARSPDLNPCDFFLWGYLKSKVYCPKPRTLDDLENNIGLLQPNTHLATKSFVFGRTRLPRMSCFHFWRWALRHLFVSDSWHCQI